MKDTYYSNGKLLLTGEYLVLYGAASLVIPLKVGQYMNVRTTSYQNEARIKWKANVLGEPWFSAEILPDSWTILKTSDETICSNLVRILREGARLNPLHFAPHTTYEIDTDTKFNQGWGFGSSSALTANIARWVNIDPFELHFSYSEGSGADVAAAISRGPVLYRLKSRKPVYSSVDFAPPFLSKLWLVYTGRKQQSSASIDHFKKKARITDKSVALMDKLTMDMIHADTLQEFMTLMSEHENVLSDIWDMPPLKSKFSDFQGEVKSLGAWGGDFIMAASEEDELATKDYFRKKQMYTAFSLDQIILQ